MDFAAKLRSPSVCDNSVAAIFLRAEGANGAEHLIALLQKCQSIDVSRDLDRFEQALVGFGAMTLGDIVGAAGFDPHNALHVSILQWLVNTSSSSNIVVSAHAIYGLGNLGSCHPEALDGLARLVTSERRMDEHEFVSLRAIALRILARLDSEMAAMFVSAPAFEEYARAVEYWLNNSATRSEDTVREFQEELDWLKKTRLTLKA